MTGERELLDIELTRVQREANRRLESFVSYCTEHHLNVIGAFSEGGSCNLVTGYAGDRRDVQHLATRVVAQAITREIEEQGFKEAG